jgi:hypothetical protein
MEAETESRWASWDSKVALGVGEAGKEDGGRRGRVYIRVGSAGERVWWRLECLV